MLRVSSRRRNPVTKWQSCKTNCLLCFYTFMLISARPVPLILVVLHNLMIVIVGTNVSNNEISRVTINSHTSKSRNVTANS